VQWGHLDAIAWDERLKAQSRRSVLGVIRDEVPARLAERLLNEAGVPRETPLAQLPKAARRALVELLAGYLLPWTGDEGYRKAEVTGGGVALGEVDPVTLESRRQPGLFLAGEILDAFGPIGGYNFAWAWATGRLAGRAGRPT
jgi:predicted flavoprotein YhiN